MASDKSLAAEIEAVLMARLDACTSNGVPLILGISEAATEIAALQSRAFEDGAQWMRLKAASIAATPSLGNVPTAQQADGRKSAAAAILAIPLQPKGERNA